MKFQFRPVLSVCALAGLAVLLTLGTWQLQRLEWKRDLIAKSTARVDSVPISLDTLVSSLAESVDQEYQPVFLVGSYDHAGEERVFGTLDGKPIMPIQISSTLIEDLCHKKFGKTSRRRFPGPKEILTLQDFSAPKKCVADFQKK